MSLADAVRSHWQRTFEEDGSTWLFETIVGTDGEITVLRQIVVDAGGHRHGYSWEHLEDDDGGLAETALDPSIGMLDVIDPEAFATAWQELAER